MCAAKQTCLNCAYWSTGDGHCIMLALAHDDYSPIPPETPACPEFQPE